MITHKIQSIVCSSALLLLAGSPLTARAQTNDASTEKQPVPSVSELTATNDTPSLAPASSDTPLTPKKSAFHVALGTRSLFVNLLADSKGRPFENSFVGSITKLEADQDYAPVRPYAQITALVGPAELGLGISYDSLTVATMDSDGGDGDIVMDCWMAYLVAAYPNKTRFTPFGEVGLASYQNTFEPFASWAENGKREFALENSQSIYYAGGCDITLGGNWSANLYLRYMDVEVDGEYIFRGDSRPSEPFTFTLEHMAYGVGVKYTF